MILATFNTLLANTCRRGFSRFRRWTRSWETQIVKSKRKSWTRLQLEQLEDRTVPSVVAVNDFPIVDVDTPATFSVLANDINPTGSGLEVLSNTPVAPGGPSLTQNGDGSFNFQSAATGTFSFDYTITGAMDRVVGSDTDLSDIFGGSVSMSGDTVVVGAMDNNGVGAAYVFVFNGTAWTEQQKITASDAGSGDLFGRSVSVSGDTLVVGSPYNDEAYSNAGAAYVFTRSGTTWTQQQKLLATDPVAGDLFGWSVSISGDTVVVGSTYNSEFYTYAGAAYVFTRSGTTWTQQQKLLASDAAAGDQLGGSVSVDGDTVVVGAAYNDESGADAGAAYVFTRSGTTWTEQDKLLASDAAAGDRFGWSVSANGDTTIVGAPFNDGAGADAGAAYVFTRSGTTWSEQQRLSASDATAGDQFGFSVSVSGDNTVVGAPYHYDALPHIGAAYQFVRGGTTWTEQQKLTAVSTEPADKFGWSVSVNGDTVVVGAPDSFGADYSGAAFIRNVSTSQATVTVTVVDDAIIAVDDNVAANPGVPITFDVLANDINPDGSGLEVILNTPPAPAGPTLVANTDGTFTFTNAAAGTFTFDYIITGAEHEMFAQVGHDHDYFGYSVAISGDTIVVGAPYDDGNATYSGAAYVFVRSGATWVEQQKLMASNGTPNDGFGWSVSISGDTVVVGSPYSYTGSSYYSGTAYVFTRVGTTWTEQQELIPSDTFDADLFGWSVSVSGDTALVSAPNGYDYDAGVYSGSAYVFVRLGSIWQEQTKLVPSDGADGDFFGASVSMFGDTAVVGAPYGSAVGYYSGSAYVFVRSGTTWTQQQELSASDAVSGEGFGWSVSVNGDTLIAGAPYDNGSGYYSGAAYVFTRAGTTWSEQQKLVASDPGFGDWFGWSVSVSGDNAVVGAPKSSDVGIYSGAAYVFTRSGTTWTELRKLIASDGVSFDGFGYSVAISGDTAVAGALYHEVNGFFSGSAYARNISQATATVTVIVTANGPLPPTPDNSPPFNFGLENNIILALLMPGFQMQFPLTNIVGSFGSSPFLGSPLPVNLSSVLFLRLNGSGTDAIGEISGVVFGGSNGGDAKQEGATLILEVLQGGKFVFVAVTSSDASGQYVFNGLPAGTYRVRSLGAGNRLTSRGHNRARTVPTGARRSGMNSPQAFPLLEDQAVEDLFITPFANEHVIARFDDAALDEVFGDWQGHDHRLLALDEFLSDTGWMEASKESDDTFSYAGMALAVLAAGACATTTGDDSNSTSEESQRLAGG